MELYLRLIRELEDVSRALDARADHLRTLRDTAQFAFDEADTEARHAAHALSRLRILAGIEKEVDY